MAGIRKEIKGILNLSCCEKLLLQHLSSVCPQLNNYNDLEDFECRSSDHRTSKISHFIHAMRYLSKLPQSYTTFRHLAFLNGTNLYRRHPSFSSVDHKDAVGTRERSSSCLDEVPSPISDASLIDKFGRKDVDLMH